MAHQISLRIFGSLSNIPHRRNIQLLLTAHRLLRLHARTVAPLRHTGRRHRGRHDRRLGYSYTLLWQPSNLLVLQLDACDAGYDPHCSPTAWERRGTTSGLLPHTGQRHTVCGSDKSDQFKCRRLYQENDGRGHVSDCVLRGQHHW